MRVLRIELPTPLDCFQEALESAKEKELLENILMMVSNQLPQNFSKAFRVDVKSLAFDLESDGIDWQLWRGLNKEAKGRVQAALCGEVKRAGWTAAQITDGKMGPETIPHFIVQIIL